ncbi:MAG: ABC transporter permease [Coriobacteriia bacterium]|nr:ABC transporter permease [Coriobacteriia bacterium]
MIRQVLALVRLHVAQLLRDPPELIGLVAVPLLLMYVFGSAFRGAGAEPVRVAFSDEDSSTASRAIARVVDAEEAFEVTMTSAPKARQLVQDGKAALAVLVPDGFEAGLADGRAKVVVVRDPADEASWGAFAVVRGAVLRVEGNARAARTVTAFDPSATFASVFVEADASWEPTPPVSTVGERVARSSVRGDSVLPDQQTLSAIGFTVWFVLFMTLGTAGGILEERESGTLLRLLSTPVRTVTLVAGKVAGVFASAALQACVLVTVGALAYGVPWFRDPGGVALLLGAYLLAATGLGVAVSALARTRAQMSGLTPLVATGAAMLGGCLWPIEIVPPVMQYVARLLPTGWAVAGLTDVVVRNQGIQSALVPAGVLLGMAVVTLALGSRIIAAERSR